MTPIWARSDDFKWLKTIKILSRPDRFLPDLQVLIVKSVIFVCKKWIAQKIFNFLVPWYALHAPFMENKENCRFKKQGKDPSCKGLPSYNRGKGKGRQGSLPFHIDSTRKVSHIAEKCVFFFQFKLGRSISTLSKQQKGVILV